MIDPSNVKAILILPILPAITNDLPDISADGGYSEDDDECK
ncbi:MAG TPA: hypothetical protein VM802_07105 [Chitinophaga sp.]|nr:hypothetical protein [Chitinophaga sp.]HVI44618.1 hypothetical protein [Chitinophaga sp.]